MGVSLSVFSAGQLLKMGSSVDYGVCTGKRKDGMPCTMVINKYVFLIWQKISPVSVHLSCFNSLCSRLWYSATYVLAASSVSGASAPTEPSYFPLKLLASGCILTLAQRRHCHFVEK